MMSIIDRRSPACNLRFVTRSSKKCAIVFGILGVVVFVCGMMLELLLYLVFHSTKAALTVHQIIPFIIITSWVIAVFFLLRWHFAKKSIRPVRETRPPSILI